MKRKQTVFDGALIYACGLSYVKIAAFWKLRRTEMKLESMHFEAKMTVSSYF